jgi:hypothetical protein
MVLFYSTWIYEESKMELKDFIRLELDDLKRAQVRILNGLSRQELIWRPCAGCNSIGLIVFHSARSEDRLVQARLLGKPEIWETEKWYQKLNLPVTEAGNHYNPDQVNTFMVPEIEALLAYSATVRVGTLDYLQTLKSGQFEKIIKTPHFGDIPIAAMFALIVEHVSQHLGEMSYLRGIQRGMDK